MEIWKDIKGYEGLYQVSNLGRVKSLNYRGVIGSEKVLKQIKDKDNYLFVNLFHNKKHKVYKIHRLVCLMFIPNPNNLPQVNHKDEDKTNNCVDNLEWCDAKYNINYGNHNYKMGTAHKKPILQYTLEGEFIKKWESKKDIEIAFGKNGGAFHKCCQGKQKTAYGYIWRYAS